MHYLVKTHNNNTVLTVAHLKTEKESGNIYKLDTTSVFHAKKTKQTTTNTKQQVNIKGKENITCSKTHVQFSKWRVGLQEI